MKTPYEDMVVIYVIVANFKVQKMMVDNGNAADILFMMHLSE